MDSKELQRRFRNAGWHGPVEIQAKGFDALRELPRAGLLLANAQVYLTWGSSCDVGPYHGWVMSYDERTLKQSAVLNTSPDAEEIVTYAW